MIVAPLPANEFERQAALESCQVLDTAPEAGFDDLTALAAQICNSPIALISLIDRQRQWFKSHHGLRATETPREVAFCTHALLQTGPLVIPDATLDRRFHDNPLTTGEPHVRFYAGVPLIDRAGHALGTLCVIDHVARILSSQQLDMLVRLGRQAVDQLELRRTRAAACRASQAKSAFLTTMNHELRTQLNGIMGMSQLLSETGLTSEQREMLVMVQRCGQRLLGLVNTIRDFSQADQPEFDLLPQDPPSDSNTISRWWPVSSPTG